MGIALAAATAAEFHSPGSADFELPPLFTIASFGFTKPMLIIVIGTVVVGALFYVAARRAAAVPSKTQFAGESVYGFVRNSIALDAIGKEGIKYVPYLVTLFTFILALNISGIIPVLQFPATARIAIPLGLAAIAYVIFNYVGIRRKGWGGYFKGALFPPGVPKAVYILLTPIEFFSTFIIRPATLTLRLCFNMFAGHLVLLLFILGGEYLVFERGGPVGIAAGSVSLLGSIVLTGFEGFVQILQAYVFTLLTALYIGGALADEH